MRPPFRSKQEVIINAPLEAVWSFSMDLTKIPEFHPRVFKVDLLAGKAFREPGVSYQCHLSGGKHTCIEKGHRDRPAGEDRHRIAARHVGDKQDSRRLQGGNHVSKTRRLFNKGGDQPLLLDENPEGHAPQPDRTGQNCSRYSSNFEVGQSCNRSRSAHRTGMTPSLQ